MKYQVDVEGRQFEVEIKGDTVWVDGASTPATILTNANGAMVLRLNNRTVSIAFVPNEEGWVASRSGDLAHVTVETERDRLLRKFTAAGGSSKASGAIKAPMPGLVLRMLVHEGEKVQKGQGLLVLEAMKMENEIKSPVGGVVGPFGVEPGQAVEKGTLLFEVLPEG